MHRGTMAGSQRGPRENHLHVGPFAGKNVRASWPPRPFGGPPARGQHVLEPENLKVNLKVPELPSALSHRDELAARLAGKRLAVFLDFDGTLAPVVDRPDMAVLSESMRGIVRTLAQRCPVIVISGRDRRDVHERVGLDELVYAGSHGFDIAWPDSGAEPHADCTKFRDLLKEAGAALERNLAPVEGVIVEPKSCSVAIHYRLTKEADAGAVKTAVDGVLADHPRLRAVSGKKVYEILPRLDWDKGKAVLWMLKALGLDGPDVVPIYVGDDITDEDAFNALEGRGICVYVSDGVDGGAPPAGADYCVKDPDEVGLLLTFLADREYGGGEGIAR